MSEPRSRALQPFWLDGGYDIEDVEACRHHPRHAWVTLRLGVGLLHPPTPDELLTICRACLDVREGRA